MTSSTGTLSWLPLCSEQILVTGVESRWSRSKNPCCCVPPLLLSAVVSWSRVVGMRSQPGCLRGTVLPPPPPFFFFEKELYHIIVCLQCCHGSHANKEWVSVSINANCKSHQITRPTNIYVYSYQYICECWLSLRLLKSGCNLQLLLQHLCFLSHCLKCFSQVISRSCSAVKGNISITQLERVGEFYSQKYK